MKDTDDNKYTEIDVENIEETELAVKFDNGDKVFWIPMSCMEDWPEKGEAGEALVAIWFAKKMGLI